MVAAVEPIQPAEPEPRTFEFAGDTWTIDPDMKPLRFQRFMERGQVTEALEHALGTAQYNDIEDICGLDDLNELSEHVAKAIGGKSVGESRASRRSSQRTARR